MAKPCMASFACETLTSTSMLTSTFSTLEILVSVSQLDYKQHVHIMPKMEYLAVSVALWNTGIIYILLLVIAWT